MNAPLDYDYAGLTSFYSEVMKGIGAGSRLFELLDRTTAIPTDGKVFAFFFLSCQYSK